MKDHLSELHPNEMAFMCQLKKVIEAENPNAATFETRLIDLVDEKSAEMKDIKVKFSDEAKLFLENNRKEKKVLDKKHPDTKKEASLKQSAEAKSGKSEPKTSIKPFLQIGKAYTMATDS